MPSFLRWIWNIGYFVGLVVLAYVGAWNGAEQLNDPFLAILHWEGLQPIRIQAAVLVSFWFLVVPSVGVLIVTVVDTVRPRLTKVLGFFQAEAERFQARREDPEIRALLGYSWRPDAPAVSREDAGRHLLDSPAGIAPARTGPL